MFFFFLGDWNCPKCNYHNYQSKKVCHKCQHDPKFNQSNRYPSSSSDADNQPRYSTKADTGLVDCTGKDNSRQISFDAENKKNIKITVGINVSEKGINCIKIFNFYIYIIFG